VCITAGFAAAQGARPIRFVPVHLRDYGFKPSRSHGVIGRSWFRPLVKTIPAFAAPQAVEETQLQRDHSKAAALPLKVMRCPSGSATPSFGIWAHWGPQSAIEAADWYSKNMYLQGSKRDQDALKGTCVLDRERAVLSESSPRPWQTDTCIGVALQTR
jgi:hypothetical protein